MLVPALLRAAALGLLVAACHEPIAPEGLGSSGGVEPDVTTSLGASGAQRPDTGATTGDGTGATTAPSTPTSTTSSTDEDDTVGPLLLDVLVVPDAPVVQPPVPCRDGCPADAFCSWCDLYGPGECVPFPRQCAATPTCECLESVLGDHCQLSPEGMVIHLPFCDKPA